MISLKTISKTLLKCTGITLASAVFLLWLLPTLFPQTVADKVTQWVNGKINGELAFQEVSLSFFEHFPSLTLTLHDVSLKGAAPFQHENLLVADELAFGIDLAAVLKQEVFIDKLYLNKGEINIQVDSLGKANYAIYQAQPTTEPTSNESNTAKLRLENIQINDCELVYNDRSLPMLVKAHGFNYSGKGDLSKAIFDLHTHTTIDSLDFYYANQPYVLRKKVNADLITSVNTNTLAFIFQKNDLKINQLPIDLTGKFEFLKNGYDMNFKLLAQETDLYNIITVLPPEYLKWLDKTEVKGKGNLELTLAGKYIAATNTSPDLVFKMNIHDGFVAYKQSNFPMENFLLTLEANLKGLNPEKVKVRIDTLHFTLDKGFFNAKFLTQGLTQPHIFAKIATQLDLEKVTNALGDLPFTAKGMFQLEALAEGIYKKEIRRSGKLLNQVDTLITSVPVFKLTSSIQEGVIKFPSMPAAITNINIQALASCPDHNYFHSNLQFNQLNFKVLTNFVKGYLHIKGGEGFPMDARIQSLFNLEDIEKVYPLEGTKLIGKLAIDIKTKGKYLPKRRLFPQTMASLQLRNGTLKTQYSPEPLQNIQISADIMNKGINLTQVKVKIKPISFELAGQPFMLKADLQNFDNLKYHLISRGTIDVGKLYQVFGMKDYDVKGIIQTNFSLRGTQKDALAGQYEKLKNIGSINVANLQVSTLLFPKPFLIHSGVFTFNQDKLRFDVFKGQYGKSDIELNGNLDNIINYATKPNASLTGNFDLKSKRLVIDELMSYSATSQAGKGSSGVVVIPKNLNVQVRGQADKVNYDGLLLNNFVGDVCIQNGVVRMEGTGFEVINAPVTMDASYKSLSAKKAMFDYHISAKEFDIKRAYNEIPLFRKMATAAAGVEGKVGLDYQLSGKLNANMDPIFPSLKGGGTLTVEQVKMKGFKLFNAVAKVSGKEDMAKDAEISKVKIKTSIANNVITIDRTKVKMAGFRFRFDGQTTFDNKLNLNARLGLPPMGIIGIPMNITGTSDKPNIKLGKSKEGLEETVDSTDVD